jgi:rhamnosyl/mannosyltransferase
VDTLIQALPHISARLLIGGDGPMRDRWAEAVAALGLRERVRFLGRVPDEDLPRLYAAADLFVLPANARAEAFGKVLLEAMAAGLACVTTEVGTGTSFVVQHEKTGLVVPPQDPAALAQAINRLLADDTLRRRMGAAGRARVRAEFLPQLMVARVQAVYAQALAHS